MVDETIGFDRASAIRLRAGLGVVDRSAWFGFARARCAEGLSASNRLLGAEVDAGLALLLTDGRGEDRPIT